MRLGAETSFLPEDVFLLTGSFLFRQHSECADWFVSGPQSGLIALGQDGGHGDCKVLTIRRRSNASLCEANTNVLNIPLL